MESYAKLLLLLLTSTTLCSAGERVSLNGDWTVDGGSAGITIPATVPGGIFSDLMNNGKIGDIFAGTGDIDYAWVGETDWTYTRSFDVDSDFLQHRIVSLVFEGLDTFATISVNGNEIGSSENMFVRYSFDVKDYLQEGSNEITVAFTSAVHKAAALAQDPNNTYVIPPECPAPEYRGICHANRIRKMQASFSWDWGPAFASAGIWKDVYLVAFNTAIIKDVVVTPLRIPEEQVWRIYVDAYLDTGTDPGVIEGVLTTTIDLIATKKTASVKIEPSKDRSFEYNWKVTMDVDEFQVDLWWPNGWGPQTLYNFSVEFDGVTGSEISEVDETNMKIGFRTVELVQETLDQGTDFYFKVNDHPMFARGANEIPISVLPEKGQDPEAVRRVLETARDTNMNMLRVWGGGVYESDYFYDLADEYGLLIWQDFMFACAMYPADEAYLNNVVAEVTHQIRRLGSHPSIAIWSGNNENEGALSDNWYGTDDNFDVFKQDYVKLYVDTIQAIVDSILPPSRNFVTSSPTNGLESDQEGHVADWPGNPLYGDVHFYDYTSDSWAGSTFPVARFASEYGYQSMPSIEAWLTATDNLDDVKPSSSLMAWRQHHPDGNTQNLNLLGMEMQLPDESNENYVKAFIYFSQISQSQAIKVQTEHYRSYKGRLNSQGQGNTMGALYWQLNDVWVAPTWSGMDFTGRWKILQYQSRDFFSSLIITGSWANDNDLEIYAVLDDMEAPNVTVKAVIHVHKWDSLDPLVALEAPVTLDPLKAVLVETINAPTALTTAGCGSDYSEARKNCFFHLHLMDQDNNPVAPPNFVITEKLKNSNLANANVAIASINAADSEGKEFDIEVTTDAIALFVWLDTHEIRGRFSDNGFLDASSTKTVRFTAEEATTVEALTAALTVTHLRDPAYL